MSERLTEIRETWRPEEMVPVPPSEAPDRLDVARQDIAYLWVENAALRIRAEQAETVLAGIADVLNQELRENGGDHFQVNGIGDDMRPAIRALVDCVYHRACRD